jgi:hypothetical protein
MFRKASNVFSVLLSDASATTSALNTAVPVGTVVTNANLPAGAVVVCDMGMRRLDNTSYTALSATDDFFIVQGKGANVPLMKSPAITKGSFSLTASKFKAAVQQMTYVGYNLTTGNLPTANNTDFWIKVRKRDNDAANRSQPMSLFAGPVQTDATGTQEELAFALAKNGIRNFAQEPANGYLKFEVVSNGTLAAIGTATLAATNGSKLLTYSAAHSLVLGDLIFIAGATYKVAAVPSATTVTLNIAFQGTTVAALATGTTYASTHGKLTVPTSFGVRLTGVPANFDVNQMRDYYANRFTTTFSDSSVLITVSGAQNGNGVWQQVAMDEYLSYGYEGQNNQLATPSVPRDQVVKIPGVAGNTALTSRYSTLAISWTDQILGLASYNVPQGNVILHCNLTSATNGLVTATTAEALVNTLLSGTPATNTLAILNMP